MSDDVRAVCEAAMHEIRDHALDPAYDWPQYVDIIERRIAPLLRSVRNAAIEECAKSVGSFPLSVDEENRGRLVNRLRALTQPAPEQKEK